MLNSTHRWQPWWYVLGKHILILLQKVSDHKKKRDRHILKRKQGLFANESIANSVTRIQIDNIRFSGKQTRTFQFNHTVLTMVRFRIFLIMLYKFFCYNLIFTFSMLNIFLFLSSSNIILKNSFRSHRMQHNFFSIMHKGVLILFYHDATCLYHIAKVYPTARSKHA
uniref:Uncharacterized protein n=1 Tax=Oryza nivara TaxID=4536 RepID=A0A0E0G7H1_ORYNI